MLNSLHPQKYSVRAPICFLAISFFSLLLFSVVGCASHESSIPDEASTLASIRSFQRLRADCPEITHGAIDDTLRKVTHRVTLSWQQRSPSSAPVSPLQTVVLNCSAPFTVVSPQRVVYISRGMLQLIPSEAALAFLIAHELGHSELGHLHGAHEKGSSTRKEDEVAADKFALKMVIAAHYNPWAALDIFQSPAIQYGRSPETSTHPYPIERHQILEEYLATAQWSPPGTVSSRSFLKMKRLFS